jgi:hypothetical protein
MFALSTKYLAVAGVFDLNARNVSFQQNVARLFAPGNARSQHHILLKPVLNRPQRESRKSWQIQFLIEEDKISWRRSNGADRQPSRSSGRNARVKDENSKTTNPDCDWDHRPFLLHILVHDAVPRLRG